jgi:hypothetical protein
VGPRPAALHQSNICAVASTWSSCLLLGKADSSARYGASHGARSGQVHEAVLDHCGLRVQSGERIRGRRNIQASRFAQPSRKRFTVRRILGAADLWITELVIAYDALPSYTVSIMEFRDGKVARETQYFGDPFEPGPSRAQWVERMP